MASEKRKGRKPARSGGSGESVDTRLLRALAHPMRQRILRALEGREASPVQLARELDEPIGNVAYHVKTLEQLGAVELVRTAPVRGAVEHFYRATARVEIDAAHWAQLPASLRRKLFDQELQTVWERLVDASGDDGFDDSKPRVSSTSLELDSEGYEQVVEIMNEMLDRVMDIQADASSRLADAPTDGAEGRRTEVVMLHFDRPESAAKPAPEPKPSASQRRK